MEEFYHRQGHRNMRNCVKGSPSALGRPRATVLTELTDCKVPQSRPNQRQMRPQLLRDGEAPKPNFCPRLPESSGLQVVGSLGTLIHSFSEDFHLLVYFETGLRSLTSSRMTELRILPPPFLSAGIAGMCHHLLFMLCWGV